MWCGSDSLYNKTDFTPFTFILLESGSLTNAARTQTEYEFNGNNPLYEFINYKFIPSIPFLLETLTIKNGGNCHYSVSANIQDCFSQRPALTPLLGTRGGVQGMGASITDSGTPLGPSGTQPS